MTSIQVADETFVAAAPALVAEVVGERANWRRWWPDLRLEVVEDRHEQGVRWQVSGPVTGTMEIWAEAVLDGVVLHYFMHAEPTDALPSAPRARMDRLAALNHARRVAGKRMSFEVKDRAEGDRAPGAPAVTADGVGV
ncbi:hypothetical protein [Gordonia soli]|uniref:Polyketide cyclase / dehydrase and lipid transport n=1 Tax=Gordonia soli NBRC 108243 TaxID=1223545 RepID=M0QQ06_9ACTN|nr:hypothetical protein [Gordonia soli]GAC69527.1 hypothetical protein GS4_25_00990 [Gordonia soli NBRC 108243]